MVIEGLVIQTIPQKERDLIVKMLERKGSIRTFYAYGGQGGGREQKSRIYEHSHLLQVSLPPSGHGKVAREHLGVVKEKSLLWQPQHIRLDYQAWALSLLFAEVMAHIAPQGEADLETPGHEVHFNVLSNALFYLDQAAAEKNVDPLLHLFNFLGKLLTHMGLYPQDQDCHFCQKLLGQDEFTNLIIEHGGFSCGECQPLEEAKALRFYLKKSQVTKTSEWRLWHRPGERRPQTSELKKLLSYWHYHTQIDIWQMPALKYLL
jgi:recombinational DNA repair protein (RecF pathway)